MGEVITLRIPRAEADKLEHLLTEWLVEIDRIRKKGIREQEEIDRLQAETRAILEEMKAA